MALRAKEDSSGLFRLLALHLGADFVHVEGLNLANEILQCRRRQGASLAED